MSCVCLDSPFMTVYQFECLSIFVKGKRSAASEQHQNKHKIARFGLGLPRKLSAIHGPMMRRFGTFESRRFLTLRLKFHL